MDKDLAEIIKNSTYSVISGTYKYLKIKNPPKAGEHFAVIEDQDEITVVTTSEKAKQLSVSQINEKNYALIALNVSIPFYSVGFLSGISGAIARRNMNILIISTFSRDYILVDYKRVKEAQDALDTLGLKQL